MAEHGQVLCWGSGEHGQHGHGLMKQVFTLNTAIAPLEQVPADVSYNVACGSSHSVCANKDCVYVWGNGSDGQLGTGNLDSQPSPVRVSIPTEVGGSSIVGVTCGASHTVILMDSGLCFGFGSNSHGQLALSAKGNHYKIEKQSMPVLLSAVQHNCVEQVACGERHTLFLYKCGAVASVGSNNHGQLGTGSRVDNSSISVLQSLSNVKVIACGDNHSLAVTDSGELYVWGYGKAVGYKYKDIVSPTKNLSHYTNITQLAAGAAHSLALTENGNVYSWGSGADGQMGHGDSDTFLSRPTKIGRDYLPEAVAKISCSSFTSLALSVTGKLYIWGKGTYIKPVHISLPTIYRPVLLEELSSLSVFEVSCGTWHVTAITGPPRSAKLSESPSLAEKEPILDYTGSNFLDSLDDEEDDLLIRRITTNTPNFLDEASSPYTESVSLSQKGTAPRRREITTLADFYAPTPEPTIKSTLSVLGDNIVRDQPAEIGRSSLSPLGTLPPLTHHSPQAIHGSPASTCHHSTSPADTCYESETVIAKNSPQPKFRSTIDYQDPKLGVPESTDTSLKLGSSGIHKADKKTSHKAISLNLPATNGLPLLIDEVAPINQTTDSKLWNPNRNSIFSSVNLHKTDSEEKSPTTNGNNNNLSVNSKMMELIDMADMKLIEKPQLPKPSRPEFSNHRHASLYSKEMAMRNKTHIQQNTSSQKTIAPVPRARPSQQQQGQIQPDFSQANMMLFQRTNAEIPIPAPRSNTKIMQKVNRRAQMLPSSGSRNRYHSAPELGFTPTAVISNNVLHIGKPLPLPRIKRSVTNLTETATKLELIQQEKKRTKLKLNQLQL